MEEVAMLTLPVIFTVLCNEGCAACCVKIWTPDGSKITHFLGPCVSGYSEFCVFMLFSVKIQPFSVDGWFFFLTWSRHWGDWGRSQQSLRWEYSPQTVPRDTCTDTFTSSLFAAQRRSFDKEKTSRFYVKRLGLISEPLLWGNYTNISTTCIRNLLFFYHLKCNKHQSNAWKKGLYDVKWNEPRKLS